MATSSDPTGLSTEAINEIGQYINPQNRCRFETARNENNLSVLHKLAQQIFSTCSTSLLSVPLDGIPSHPELRKYIKHLHIQDESDKVDPWVCDGTIESPFIWPRIKNNLDITPVLGGIEDVRRMLLARQICPNTLRISDYISSNVELYNAKTKLQIGDWQHDPWTHQNLYGPVAALARRVIDGSDLAVTSISMQGDSVDIGETNYLTSHKTPGKSIGGPQILRVTIDLSPENQALGRGMSMLRTARLQRLRDDPYWLDQALHHAYSLQSLELTSIDSSLLTQVFHSDLPTSGLKHLTLSGNRVDTITIFSILQSSKATLESLHLRDVTLTIGSSWPATLSRIAEDFPSLMTFNIYAPKAMSEVHQSPAVISFLGFKKEMVPEECQTGLILDERGHIAGKSIRLTRITYQGPKAGLVLKELAGWAHVM